MKDSFNFTLWVAEAFNTASREIIKKAIITLEKEGIGTHSFYITLMTNNSKIVIPDYIKSKYPEVITIVLEKQFENLKTTKTGFFIELSFDNKTENLFIPFDCIINFLDKSTNINISTTYSLASLHSKTSKKKVETKTDISNKKNNIINFRLED